jgi:hypothetical protein
VKSDHDIPTDNVLQQNKSQAHKEFEHVNSTLPVDSQAVASSTKATYLKSNGSSSIGPAALKSDSAAAKNYSGVLAKPGKKKMRCEMPPKSVTLIDEMNSILVRHRRSSRSKVFY